MPKISIIIPCYNMGEFIEDCLNRLVNQTLEDIEIICINDGSKDNTEEILKKYQQKDSRIKVINKDNQGVGFARNDGIKFAKGEFLAFLDPDDFYYTNDILEVLYKKAIENNVLVAGGGVIRFSDNRFFQDYKDSYTKLIFDKDELISYKDYQYDFGFVRFIYNREFIIKNNLFFPDYERFQDPPFFIKALHLAENFYAVNKIVYAYRENHKVLKWTPKKVNGLLRGLIDDVKLAKENNYNELKNLSIFRFYNEYNEEIFKNATFENQTLIVQFMLLTSFVGFLKFFTKKIFSIANSKDKTHKIITVLGFKIKLKRK